jgi:hypothetical protein
MRFGSERPRSSIGENRALMRDFRMEGWETPARLEQVVEKRLAVLRMDRLQDDASGHPPIPPA